MIYIEKLKIQDKQDFPGAEVLKRGFEIECGDVNLLVGNQGCGKSTFLTMLQKNHPGLEITISEYTKINGVNSFFFNSELDNPRVKGPELFTTPGGENIGIGMGGALASRFMSHGEVLESFVINPLNEAENCVVILDEPESGLSITNQFKLIQAIKRAVKNGCQIFIATHCYPLIQEFDVISLEHYEKMSGTEFIEKTFGQD